MGGLTGDVTSGGSYGWVILDTSMPWEESAHQYRIEKQCMEAALISFSHSSRDLT